MKAAIVILLLGLICALAGPVDSQAQMRGGGFSPRVERVVSGLNYHALIIGINEYRYGIPTLNTSVNDARAVKDVLVSKYGFDPQNIIELYDAAATRGKIYSAFRGLAKSLGDSDALIVYFAGHGIEDIATGTGYWIPSDAQVNAFEDYFANADIRSFLGAIPAKHIFLVSDSCFSGKLLDHKAMPGEIDDPAYADYAAKRSRMVLTSGGSEPVADAGKSGHSIFGYFFLKTLRDYDRPYLIPSQISEDVKVLVARNARQIPQSGHLREAMDENGEIVLVNRQYAASSILSFASNRPGKVYLNGEYIGETPIGSYRVAPGTHSWKMACPEYGMDKSGSVELAAGDKKEIRENFAPESTPKRAGTGLLTVATRPWSRIEIDGRDYGVSPLAQVELPAGKHTLRLTNTGAGVDKTIDIRIVPGGHVKIGPKFSIISK